VPVPNVHNPRDLPSLTALVFNTANTSPADAPAMMFRHAEYVGMRLRKAHHRMPVLHVRHQARSLPVVICDTW